MVSISLGESSDKVRAWGERVGVGFPLWLDPSGKSSAAFRVPGHPSTVLLDRQGRVVVRVPGERKWSGPEARRLLEWLLAGREP